MRRRLAGAFVCLTGSCAVCLACIPCPFSQAFRRSLLVWSQIDKRGDCDMQMPSSTQELSDEFDQFPEDNQCMCKRL